MFGAGGLAGLAGTAGGITSLISYPALLAVGLSPIRANMTNSVALVGNWPGSTLAARPELAGRARRLRQLAPVAAAGGLLGAVLLLGTPAAVFDRFVPFFLAAASVALLCQPRLVTWRRRYLGGVSRLLLFAGLFGVCLYDGYFGAGSGVMLLALLLIAIDENLPRANAYKNFLLGVSDVISAAGFAIFGSVDWLAAVSVGLGALLGGAYGPRLTRRLPPGVLRVAVALAGLGLAVKLFLSPT
ncbi:MAG TPA: sulfite exporter TauE/SafE family protein [Acidimicrobiales bacterium]|nr:sulfite exporter TauE/SafE family protein [Acidimicrobiales bacterium]